MKKGPKKKIQTFQKLNFLNNPELAEFRENLFVWGSAFLVSALTVTSVLFLSLTIPLSPFLIFLLPVVYGSWYGGFKVGLFSESVTLIIYYTTLYFMLPPDVFLTVINAQVLQQIIPFILVGYLVSFVIDKARKTDEISKYKKQAIKYARQLLVEEKANFEAKEEIKARDEFLSIASHELKTPLTLVLLQIQNALHNIRNVSLAQFSVAKLLDMLQSVEQQTGRLSRMINDLLNVSLITTGKLNLETEKGDLVQIVKDVSKRLPQTLDKKNYPVTFKSDGPILGFWDKVRIEQVLVNLVSNAIKYGNNKPVWVKIQKSGNLARIIVEDHGIGIPKDVKGKIFQRFERGRVSKNYQGLGVGLYITNQIIIAHGGTIKVESSEGKGSKFTIELPVKKGIKG